MLTLNIIGISNDYVYNTTTNLANNLSAFLLSIYLYQLDVYIRKLCTASNFKKFLYFKPYFINIFIM